MTPPQPTRDNHRGPAQPGPRHAAPTGIHPVAGASTADLSAQVDDIIGRVVHELASPLTVISGYAEMALLHADGELEVYLTAIERSADDLRRTATLLDEVRGLSGETMRLDRRDVDVAHIVAALVIDLTPQLAPHPVRVVADEGAVLSARVDPGRLREAVTNLLTNAAKFSSGETPIDVIVKGVNSHVQIAVRDHGAGVPDERRPELFQRFSRLGSRQKGMGLGLYLARTIAQAHSGELHYEDAPGGGSRFVITLPTG